jgi:D-lactate dehydrogenase
LTLFQESGSRIQESTNNHTFQDVFEGEKAFMFKDMHLKGFENHPDLQELASMHNVIISSHVAFYTDEAIRQITQKTLDNYQGFVGDKPLDETSFIA